MPQKNRKKVQNLRKGGPIILDQNVVHLFCTFFLAVQMALPLLLLVESLEGERGEVSAS